jgi:perosamine synthetase
MIPVNRPLLGGNEEQYVVECIRSGWIGDGRFIGELETAFAARVGRRHAIAVTNGSAALDAAVVALRLGPGDEVIIPAFCIISCAAAVVRAGAVPVLVDCDPETWNMTPAGVAERISERTRAILAVHTYGLPVEIEPLETLARQHGLRLIEDAAEMHGQHSHGRPCGSFGDVSTFSLYANKHVTSGEGGMIVTDDDEIAERCRGLRNLFMQAERRFVHEELGWNLRMTNLQAAVALAQLERLDEVVAIKRRLGAAYDTRLESLRGVQLPRANAPWASSIYWVYGVVLHDDIPFDVAEAMARLQARGVQTRPFFWPMHEQPVFRRLGLFTGERHPVSERLARRGFYLPSGVGTTADEIEAVAEALHEVIGG